MAYWLPTASARTPGSPAGGSSRLADYDQPVVVILALPVMGFVWLRRRLLIRREASCLLERAWEEAQASLREQEIIAEMERQFIEG